MCPQPPWSLHVVAQQYVEHCPDWHSLGLEHGEPTGVNVGAWVVGELDVGEADVGELDVGETDVGDAEVGETDVGDAEVGDADVGELLVGCDVDGFVVVGDGVKTHWQPPLPCLEAPTQCTAKPWLRHF